MTDEPEKPLNPAQHRWSTRNRPVETGNGSHAYRLKATKHVEGVHTSRPGRSTSQGVISARLKNIKTSSHPEMRSPLSPGLLASLYDR